MKRRETIFAHKGNKMNIEVLSENAEVLWEPASIKHKLVIQADGCENVYIQPKFI